MAEEFADDMFFLGIFEIPAEFAGSLQQADTENRISLKSKVSVTFY